MSDINVPMSDWGNLVSQIPQNIASVQQTNANTGLIGQQAAQVGLQNQRLAQQLKFYSALSGIINGGAGTGQNAADQSGESGDESSAAGPSSSQAGAGGDKSGVAGTNAPKGAARSAGAVVAAQQSNATPPSGSTGTTAAQPQSASTGQGASSGESDNSDDDVDSDVASLLDESHVLQAMRGAYYVNPAGSPQDMQALMTAVGTGDQGTIAGVQAMIARNVSMRRSQVQLAAADKYDELATVVKSPHPATMLGRMQDPYLQSVAAQIGKQYPDDPEKQDEVAGEFASQLGSQLHQFTGRGVKVDTGGVTRDAVTGLPISGVPVAGLSAYQYGKLMSTAESPVSVPQSDGSEVSVPRWKYAGAASANAYVAEVADRQAAANGLNTHVAQTLAPQIRAAQQAQSAAQASRTPPGAPAVAAGGNPLLADPQVNRAAFSDANYFQPPPRVTVGTSIAPGVLDMQKKMNAARIDLMKNQSDIAMSSANSLTYLNAAQAVLNSPGRPPIGAGAGVMAAINRSMQAAGISSGDYASRYAELEKNLMNNAVQGLKSTFASSRVAAQEVQLAINKLNPSAGMPPAAVRNLIGEMGRIARYNLSATQLAKVYIAKGGDPTAYEPWLQKYYDMPSAVNKQSTGNTPSASGSTAARPMPSGPKLSAYASKYFGGDTTKASQFLASQGYK